MGQDGPNLGRSTGRGRRGPARRDTASLAADTHLPALWRLRGERALLLGLIVSLAVHGALTVGFVRYSQLTEPRRLAAGERAKSEFLLLPPETSEEPDDPEPRRITLGLDQGSPEATAWLGFEDETEHEAPLGPLDQSAMRLAEDDPGNEGIPALDAQAAAPQAVDEQSELIETKLAEAMMAEPEAPDSMLDPQPDQRAEIAPAAQRLTEAFTAATEAMTAALEAAREASELFDLAERSDHEQAEHAEVQEEASHAAAPAAASDAGTEPAPHEAADAAPATPATVNGGSSGVADPSAIPTDRESVAAAVREAPAIRPGRVLAAEGMEIQTRAPRWSYTTLATRRPRNPTVEIFFGPDGRVRRAAFVTDGSFVYNTGSNDVDQPLLSAIYAWTARGKAIDELKEASEQDEAHEVRVMITIILVG